MGRPTKPPSRWQPRGEVEIDWANPLADGLLFFYSGNVWLDLAGNRSPIFQSGELPETDVNRAGVATKDYLPRARTAHFGDGFNAARWIIGRSIAAPLTIACFARCEVVGGTAVIFGACDSSDHLIRLQTTPLGNVAYTNYDGTNIVEIYTDSPAAHEWFHLAGISHSASSHDAWCNLHSGGTSSTTANTTISGSGSIAVAAQYDVSYAINLTGSAAACAIWTKDIGESGVREHYANPWQLVRRRVRRLYFGASAAPTFNAAWNQAANTTISSGARTA